MRDAGHGPAGRRARPLRPAARVALRASGWPAHRVAAGIGCVMLAAIALVSPVLGAPALPPDFAACIAPPPFDPAQAVLVEPARLPGTGSRPPPSHAPDTRVEVRVVAPGPMPPSITVDAEHDVTRAISPLLPTNRPYVYAATLPSATYVLKARAASGVLQLESPAMRVEADHDLLDTRVQLAARGSPFYRMGNGLVPFTPSDVIAVVFDAGAAPTRRATDVLDAAVTRLRLKRLDAPTRSPAAGQGRPAPVLLEAPAGPGRAAALGDLRLRLAHSARVGLVIDADSATPRILDNQFVIRFATGTADRAYRAALKTRLNLETVRTYPGDPDVWIVRFNLGDYRRHLATINCLVEARVLVTGEPDLMVSLAAHALPNDWPHDPDYFAFQHVDQPKGNHFNQSVRGAWQQLFVARTGQVASPSVQVALLDSAVNPNNAEVKCMVNGAPQVSQCVDPWLPGAASGNNCLLTDPDQSVSHGMAMFGIIAACTNNESSIAGIAPGARLTTVRLDTLSSVFYGQGEYADLLMWMGGEPLGCGDQASATDACRWNAVLHPADVINCSHGLPGVGIVPTRTPRVRAEPAPVVVPVQGANATPQAAPLLGLPESIGLAYERLTNSGRGGKGVILVYSAGNAFQDIVDHAPFAQDPRTIAVSNCAIGSDGVERLFLDDAHDHASGSNFGDRIDICADGEGSRTIPPACDLGQCIIGGTSAAAATVTGAVALMLSMRPSLTVQEVRRILRSTAEKIDAGQTDPDGQWVQVPGQGLRSRWYGSGRLNVEKAVTQMD